MVNGRDLTFIWWSSYYTTFYKYCTYYL